MPYAYRYTPKGNHAEKVIDWLNNQKNKAESLNLLILRAQQEYGNEDIVDLTTQAFLNNQIQVNRPSVNNQPIKQNSNNNNTPQSNPQNPQPETNPAPQDNSQNNPNPTTNQAESQKPKSNPKKNVNVKFLSH